MRSTKIAFVLALVFTGVFASNLACAQRQERGAQSYKAPRGKGAPPHQLQADRGGDGARSAVPPDLEQRRRDGHMTPEERHLLRQHIEDAVRELYKR